MNDIFMKHEVSISLTKGYYFARTETTLIIPSEQEHDNLVWPMLVIYEELQTKLIYSFPYAYKYNYFWQL
jgi:hypothetical protein